MGWTSNVINQLVIQGTNAGLFIYNGTPTLGALIGSWASNAGVDPFGNPYPAGINVLAGSLQGVSVTNGVLIGGTIFNALVSASQIEGSEMLGGNITETTITFDTGGGNLFLYSTSTTTNTYTTSQNISAPAASVPSMLVQVWGADAAGGGGSTAVGGEAGGGAEFASEPAYPNYNPGGTYAVNIGVAGVGANTGHAGTSGTRSSFDNTGVIAGGGLAGTGGVGGLGGNISTNTIHFKGGNGGSNPSNFTSSAGGGGRAGSTGAGGNGGNPTANASPGFGGSAGTGIGGIVGSNGVVAATNGNGGNAGGSGAGQGSGGTTYISKFYDPTSTDSYYGSGVGGGLHDHNGVMYQGCPNSGLNNFPGDELSYANYNHAQIASEFSGATIDSVKLTIHNQGSWFNTGGYLILSYADGGGDHYTGNYYWVVNGSTPQIDVSGPLNAQIKTLLAIKLGPSALTGNATSLYNYAYFTGGAGAGGPRLTVDGHIGTTGNFTSGGGSNGKVIVSYQSTNVLVGALSPVAGTDAGGNAFAIGYTGPAQAIHPGSNPATVEGWQGMTGGYTNSWSDTGGGNNVGRYKRLTEKNMVRVEGTISHASVTGTSAFFTLPVGYRPATAQIAAFWGDQGAHMGLVGVATTGILSFFNLNASTLCQFQGEFGLD
jgi:hypothetical protein